MEVIKRRYYADNNHPKYVISGQGVVFVKRLK